MYFVIAGAIQFMDCATLADSQYSGTTCKHNGPSAVSGNATWYLIMQTCGLLLFSPPFSLIFLPPRRSLGDIDGDSSRWLTRLDPVSFDAPRRASSPRRSQHHTRCGLFAINVLLVWTAIVRRPDLDASCARPRRLRPAAPVQW
jgi:hypothetical protein